MDTIKKNLNSIGLGLLLLALAALKIWPQSRPLFFILGGLGLAAIVVYLVLNAGQLKEGLQRRSFLYSSNLLLMIALVLAILVLVNYLGTRHHKRLDFTQTKLHSLSDQSIKVVKALREDLQVKAFFRESNYGRGRMADLMKIYGYHSPRIKVEFIDPDSNPGLVKRYEVAQDGTTIFEYKDKDNRITSTTEEDVTNAIVKVTREKKNVVYFLEGHGERSSEVTDENGYSFLKDDLVKLGYEVKKQALALSETFPKDCALLIVPGPQKDLLPNELETIEQYLKNGGRVFFMLDPQSAPAAAAFLAKFGFKVSDDLIVDTVSRLMGGDYFMPILTEYEPHEITKNFRYATFFPYARTVELIEPKPESVSSSQVLGRTSPNSWGEHQLKDPKVKFDRDKDKAGPLSLAAVAVLKPAAASGAAPAKEGRIAVFGDSDFASNRYYNLSANANLALNVANWLTEEADLISIQPRTQNPRVLNLTDAQAKVVFWISVILLPLVVLAAGVFIWLKRRAL